MTLIVKIMSDENLPDADPRKSHRLYTDVSSVEFMRNSENEPDAPASVALNYSTPGDCETVPTRGNVYVMNEAGKTISTFSPNPVGGLSMVYVDDRPVGLDEGPIDCAALYEALGVPAGVDLYHQGRTATPTN